MVQAGQIRHDGTLGLYSVLGGEWKGQRMGGIGEWIQQYYRIPICEYEKLAKAFNPIYFDADEWVRIAQEAGMQYMVVTSKHHEGFAMFHSKVDSYNIVDATPFGRDVIGELSEACHRHGLKFGVYYSQELDWHEPNGGGWTAGKTWAGATGKVGDAYWVNNWDFPDDAHKDYSQCFQDKILPQVTELLTKYGEMCLIWFDTPHTISPAQSLELFRLVKKLQPDCLVNSRIGNGIGDYHSLGDNEIPEAYKKDGLFETPATLNDSWGYKSFDNNWKNADKVIALKQHLNERGINYLLNVGPDALGRIPAPSVEILKEVGRRGR